MDIVNILLMFPPNATDHGNILFCQLLSYSFSSSNESKIIANKRRIEQASEVEKEIKVIFTYRNLGANEADGVILMGPGRQQSQFKRSSAGKWERN